MINLKSLIDFLPPIFKNTDTYKVGGKGILERFLEVCGEYLEEDITSDIENTLDIIDIHSTDPIYLNYLWELLGEIPFGSNIAIDKDKWDMYYDGTLPKEELAQLSRNWVIPKEGIISLEDSRLRTLLKYSLALLKVRGTKKFFETLFEIYGISCTISDVDGNDDGLYAKLTKLDTYSTNLDQVTTDYVANCQGCMSIKVDISTHYFYSDILGVLIVGKDDVYLATGGKQTNVQTLEGVTLYNSYYSNQGELSSEDLNILNGFVVFRRVMEQLFDKYLPCNVKPIITYNGIAPYDKLSLSLSYETPNTTITDEADCVGIKVNITSLWPSTDTRYQVSSDGVNWGDKLYNSGDIFYIRVMGDYYFRSVADYTQNDAITVSDQRVYIKDVYSLNLIDTSLYLDKVENNFVKNTFLPVAKVFLSDTVSTKKIIIKVLTNGEETQDSGQRRVVIDNNGNTYRSGDCFIAKEIGEYTFTLIDNPTIFAKLEVLYYNQTDVRGSYLMGLNYGVSAEVAYSESHYDNDQGTIVEESYTSDAPYGVYGLLDGADRPKPFEYNSYGNVVTLSYKYDSSNFSSIELLKITPWAYMYDEHGSIIKQPVKLSLVDIWFSDQPALPVNIKHTDLQYTLSDIDMLKDKLSFRKLTTISVDYLENQAINLLDVESSCWNGGVFLLHPNTEELISNGITPNFNKYDFYSNFLIVVIPGLTRDGTPLPDYQKPVITETLKINEYMYSKYGRRLEYGLTYDHIGVNPNYINGKVDHLEYSFKNLLTSDTGDDNEVSQFKNTRIVAFNVTPYNSNHDTYYPWESGDGDYDDPNSSNLKTPYNHNTKQVNPMVIFMDRLAPFITTQYMTYKAPRKYESGSKLANGFYIQPHFVNQAADDIIWQNNSIENGLVIGDYAYIYPGPINSPEIDPAVFSFIAYLDGVELPIPYYIYDRLGNEYLPGVTYSIKDIGSFDYLLLPHSFKSDGSNNITPYITLISEPNWDFGKVYISKPTHIIPKSINSITVATTLRVINPQLNSSQCMVRTNASGTQILENLPHNGLFIKEGISENTTFYFKPYHERDNEYSNTIVTVDVIKNT